MERLKISVIGGSASTNFGNPEAVIGWPALLKKKLGGGENFTIYSQGGLTFLGGIRKLSEISYSDLIVFHFGTSVGWPESLVKIGPKFGIDFSSAHGFHQPPRISQNWTKRLKGFIKRRFRNTIKYIFFFTGLYRPVVAQRNLDEQIKTVIALANLKAPKIIWVQHRALQHHRILLERLVYKRAYARIMDSLAVYESEQFRIIRLPNEFMVSQNYLFDRIHLSPTGHAELEMLIRNEI